jgi:hypothetical protein
MDSSKKSFELEKMHVFSGLAQPPKSAIDKT